MAKLLYVTCNLKPVGVSSSLSLGKLVLDTYIALNPGDEIDCLDLYRDNFQRTDSDVLSALDKMSRGLLADSLNLDEQRKLLRLWHHADQFVAADKYLFVTPMHSLWFPAELKIYIDAVCLAGKTYLETPGGPVGLLRNRGKKCLHIHSSGGSLCKGFQDYSVPYLRSILGFMGVDDFEAVVIEGADYLGAVPEHVKRRAMEQALDAASRF